MLHFDIKDVANLLGFRINPSKGKQYFDCPFCGRKKQLTINYEKNIFNCCRCDTGGGILALYSKFNNLNLENSEIIKEINEKLNISNDSSYYKKRSLPKPKEEKLTIDLDKMKHYDKVYRAFLNELALAKIHYNKLKLERELTDDEIKRYMFRSVPVFGYKAICKKLIEKGYNLKGVPGFYTDLNEWTLNINSKMTGYFVPTFNVYGLIEALHIRMDKPFNKKCKYIWLTSDGLTNGAAPKTIPFFCKGNRRNNTLIVTEGEFKAIIPSRIWDVSIMAIPGVNCVKELERVVPVLKQMGITNIIEAFDADYRFNDNVKEAKKTLKEVLENKYKFNYSVLEWNIECGKGLDDYALYELHKHQEKIFNGG